MVILHHLRIDFRASCALTTEVEQDMLKYSNRCC
uniref:Uncharacterized protein n=1 Tax=Rhizophora mucronata TaxID=61149 RepID=A0A2P2IY06_RHIMU